MPVDWFDQDIEDLPVRSLLVMTSLNIPGSSAAMRELARRSVE